MRFIFLSLFTAWCFFAQAQNGKLVKKEQYQLHDSTVRKLSSVTSELKAILSTVSFYHITYLSDGLKVKGYMAVPKKPGKYPCIIYNRGGNREFGKIDDAGFVARGLGDLAKAGYVIVASQYRGNDGGEGKEEFGGADVNDVLNLIPLLSSISQADTSRMGMFGWSRGGMMTYIALTKTARIKAAVVGSGVSDLIEAAKDRPVFDSLVFPTLIPNYASNKEETLKERSAFYLAEKINKSTPILILQGTADWRVNSKPVIDLTKKFYEIKQPFRFILYEGGQHSLIEHRKDYVAQMINWFDTYLRDRKPWPSLEPHGD